MNALVERDHEVLFEALTPLGFQVRVTRGRWNLITTVKHPVMAGREDVVKATLEIPDEIRRREAGCGARVPDHRVSDRCDQGRDADMAEVRVFYDRDGKTLTVWFTERSREYVCEETGDEVVLMKDRDGRVIGFEKLNFSIPQSDSLRVALETTPA